MLLQPTRPARRRVAAAAAVRQRRHQKLTMPYRTTLETTCCGCFWGFLWALVHSICGDHIHLGQRRRKEKGTKSKGEIRKTSLRCHSRTWYLGETVRKPLIKGLTMSVSDRQTYLYLFEKMEYATLLSVSTIPNVVNVKIATPRCSHR